MTLKDIEKFLRSKSFNFLKELLDKHDKWFPYEYGPEISRVIVVKDKESIIKWIMGSDPIFAEGGLMDFMSKNTLWIEYY